MGNEQISAAPAELSPQQQEMADFYLEATGLGAVANEMIEMQGQTGTVRFGLGFCSNRLGKLTPDEIRDMVMLKIEQQKNEP